MSDAASEATPDLSVVIVNFDSADLVSEAIASLDVPISLEGGPPKKPEIIVVDNGSRHDDHALLESFAERGVTLVRNTENLGYALANNQGFYLARGRWHLVCNPDVIVLPGCLEALVEGLIAWGKPALGGPLISMDREGGVLMPPNELPTPWTEAVQAIGRYEAAVARQHARLRARRSARIWSAKEPLQVEMLSGGFFLGLREDYLKHGLFDPSYPLYLEDTDICLRYLRLGYDLIQVPSSRIIHHWSRSAAKRMGAAMHRHRISLVRYMTKFFGERAAKVVVAEHARAERLAPEAALPFELESVDSVGPPTFPLPDVAGGRHLELAGNPHFSLAVGVFPDDQKEWRVPDQFWAELPTTRFWARAVATQSGECLRAWEVQKCPK